MWPAGERAGRRRARGGGSLELSAAPVCPQAVAAQVKPLNDGGGQPPQLSPFPALSPAALSAILTPSGSGFRVDFGAALQVSGAHRKRPKTPHVHNPYLHAQPASAWPGIPQWSPRGQGYWVGVRARGRRGDREGGLVGGWRRRGRGAVCGRALSSAAYVGVGAAAIARRHATAGGGGASGLRPLAASVRRACARPSPPPAPKPHSPPPPRHTRLLPLHPSVVRGTTNNAPVCSPRCLFTADRPRRAQLKSRARGNVVLPLLPPTQASRFP